MTSSSHTGDGPRAATASPLVRALAYIGLELSGPSPATLLEKGLALLYIFIPIALLVKVLDLGGLWLFLTAALAAWLGGLGRPAQYFNRIAASANASQMALAAIGLIIPAAFVLTSPEFQGQTEEQLNQAPLVEGLSIGVAVILLAAYLAQLI